MTAAQIELFPPPLPLGFRYAHGFLGIAEESELVARVAALPLQRAQYKQWAAKRRVVSYGGRYDFARNVLLPEPPIPELLLDLRSRAAAWAGLRAEDLGHALVAEYRPQTALGWHRDVPDFEAVVGISLLGAARMRLRRYPHVVGTRGLSLELAPRSIYSLDGEARWNWQHAISPTAALRYSITFRSMRRARP